MAILNLMREHSWDYGDDAVLLALHGGWSPEGFAWESELDLSVSLVYTGQWWC